jgi:DNA-binding transcriptional ArsR family regulator
MFEFMNITKALADNNRVRILMALNGKDELCVCQMIDMLQLAPSTVSKHLFILRNARLILGRKEGRWMYYRLNSEDGPEAAREAIRWVTRSVADEPIVQEDRKRLAVSLTEAAETKCRS